MPSSTSSPRTQREFLHHSVARFQTAWRQGDCPGIDDYLPHWPALRLALLIELVRIDLAQRGQDSSPSNLNTYLQRYPELIEVRRALEGLSATLPPVAAGAEAATLPPVPASRNALLSQCLQRWDLLRKQGQTVEPEELCRDYPEILEELKRQIQGVAAVEALLGAENGQATLPQRAQPQANPMATNLGTALPAGATEKPAAVQVPGYEILGELGRGGMGVVYKARHLRLNRLVALKMVLAGGHAGSEDRVRFLAEAEAVAAMQHPNIVQVFEIGQQDGLPYMALEYVNGGSLADRLRDGLPLPKEAARLVEQLAHGMAAAHAKGIIHRDLKPHNVLLRRKSEIENPKSEKAQNRSVSDFGFRISDLEPKVTDFGLAKKVEGGSGLTQTGAVMGTPSYMAPEQAEGKKDVGPAADVYALGAILYECLTGRPPFRGSTPIDTMMQVVAEEPASVRQLQRSCPRDLETICHKCLHKEPGKRYASAVALAEDLRRFQAGEPITARPVGRVERAAKWVRRNPVLTGAIVAVTTALLLGTVVSTYFGLNAAQEANNAQRQREDSQEARGRRQEERE